MNRTLAATISEVIGPFREPKRGGVAERHRAALPLSVAASHGLCSVLRRPEEVAAVRVVARAVRAWGDGFERVEARGIGIAGVIDRLPQVLGARRSLVVGKVQGHTRKMVRFTITGKLARARGGIRHSPTEGAFEAQPNKREI
jgi:hypothetical protein